MQAAAILALTASMLARGPSAARRNAAWSPERAWWHCHVLNADKVMPDDGPMYAIRDRLAHEAVRRGEYDSSTAAFHHVLHMDDTWL